MVARGHSVKKHRLMGRICSFPAINWIVPESKFKTLTTGIVYNKGLVGE